MLDPAGEGAEHDANNAQSVSSSSCFPFIAVRSGAFERIVAAWSFAEYPILLLDLSQRTTSESTMTGFSRRGFLQGSGATLIALSCSTPLALAKRRGPNDEVRVACVGIRSRGTSHINGLHSLDGVRVVALVDVDQDVLAREKKKFTDRGEKVDTYTDLRHALDREDIDAISVASPNHWHALQAIWACQAGKDVYLEKPVSHNIWEGAQIVKAARKYKRIVQTGTQSRSSHGIAQGIDWLQAGNLGKIHLARGLCYKPRKSIGKVAKPQEVGKHIDYNLWTGPAPMKPLMRKSLHYDWHWVFDTGCGDVGNQGIHQMDIARWALGEKKLPSRTLSIGGRVGYDDDGDTPNTQMVYHEFESAPLIFEVRGLPRDKQAQSEDWGGRMDNYMGARIGVIIHCENGFLRIPDYNRAIALDLEGKEIQRFEGSSNHYANFIEAVRSRDVSTLKADIQEGHISSAMCHMGNISHHLGSGRKAREIAESVASNKAAAETYERLGAHLAANQVDVESSGLRLGPWIEMDPETETFIGNDAANRLATREYREGFVVPNKV
ncbi:MAG: putative dehydrogenase [Candidatus Paceibacteria bacterium]|jgi:predicted dehydrogenase